MKQRQQGQQQRLNINLATLITARSEFLTIKLGQTTKRDRQKHTHTHAHKTKECSNNDDGERGQKKATLSHTHKLTDSRAHTHTLTYVLYFLFSVN